MLDGHIPDKRCGEWGHRVGKLSLGLEAQPGQAGIMDHGPVTNTESGRMALGMLGRSGCIYCIHSKNELF